MADPPEKQRGNNFCPKCFGQYKELGHLKKCFPADDCGEIHKKQRKEIAQFIYKRVLSEEKLLRMAMDSGFQPQDLPKCVHLAEALGHKLHAMGTGATPAMTTILTQHPPTTLDSSQGPLRMSLRPRKASASAVSMVSAGATSELDQNSENDNTSESDQNSENDNDTLYHAPVTIPCAEISKQRVYTYPNDPVKQQLLKNGLYKAIPCSDKFLKGFQTYLVDTCKKDDDKVVRQEVKRVARYMYSLHNTGDPHTEQTFIDLHIFAERDTCGNYFTKLFACGMTAHGVRNYLRVVKEFLRYLQVSANTTDKEANLIQRFQKALEAHIKGINKISHAEEADKNVDELLDPELHPGLAEVQQAYFHLEIKQDVSDIITTAKQNKCQPKQKDRGLVMRYLAGAVFQLGHFQRPGVSANLTVAEFKKPLSVNNQHLIVVRKHKTKANYPACLSLSDEEHDLMNDYYTYVRGHVAADVKPKNSKFFRTPKGTPVYNMPNQLNALQQQYGIFKKQKNSRFQKQRKSGSKLRSKSYTANDARIAMERATKEHFSSKKHYVTQISDYLTHSENVVKKHYAKKNYADVVHARKLSMEVIDGSQASHSHVGSTCRSNVGDDGLGSVVEVTHHSSSHDHPHSPVSVTSVPLSAPVGRSRPANLPKNAKQKNKQKRKA